MIAGLSLGSLMREDLSVEMIATLKVVGELAIEHPDPASCVLDVISIDAEC